MLDIVALVLKYRAALFLRDAALDQKEVDAARRTTSATVLRNRFETIR